MTMTCQRHATGGEHRQGITLLEVLIAIGILAIGLSSVVALIPAGRSQAGRAVVLDRASNLAANALSDAVTFGLTRTDALTLAPSTGTAYVDPTLVRQIITGTLLSDTTCRLDITSAAGLSIGMRFRLTSGTVTTGTADFFVDSVDLDSNVISGTFAGPLNPPPDFNKDDAVCFAPSFASPAFNRRRGLYAGSEDAVRIDPVNQLLLHAQGRDDVVFRPGATADDLPFNTFQSGTILDARSFQGRLSCIYSIRRPNGATPGVLTTVVFHGRDPRKAPWTLNLQAGAADVSALVTTEQIQDLKPGVVVHGGTGLPRFHQIVSMSLIQSGTSVTAHMTFSTGIGILAGNHALTVLPDSVGFAERTFTAPESGQYLQ